MKIVWLVRHAERADFSEGEWDPVWPERAIGLGQDPDDAPLTVAGRRQARHAASLLHGPLNRIYSSPFLRCIETARIISDVHGVELMVSTDLTEWMNPEWFNNTYEHFEEIHFNSNRAHFARGYPEIPESEESHKERWNRVFLTLTEMDEENFPIALVTHGGGIHHLLNHYDTDIMSGKGVQFADVYRIEL